jgi:hypothetical protein
MADVDRVGNLSLGEVELDDETRMIFDIYYLDIPVVCSEPRCLDLEIRKEYTDVF